MEGSFEWYREKDLYDKANFHYCNKDKSGYINFNLTILSIDETNEYPQYNFTLITNEYENSQSITINK